MNRPSSALPHSGFLEDLLPEDQHSENEILAELHRQRDQHAATLGDDPQRISADLSANFERIPLRRAHRRPALQKPRS